MEEKEIFEISKKYCNDEFKTGFKNSLCEDLIKYLEFLNYKKSKISNREKLKLNYKIRLLKSQIYFKIDLLEE